MQATPQAPVEWQAIRLSGQDALAVRASKKLRSDELLLTGFAATRLRMELDRVPLWRGDHVAIKQLAEDFARYLYLPRLKDSSVLVGAIRDGFALLTWEQESFAFADSFDEGAAAIAGLRGGFGRRRRAGAGKPGARGRNPPGPSRSPGPSPPPPPRRRHQPRTDPP